jgi:type I restriction enzyme M protein
MSIRMFNPKENEFVMDPAAGSCGFTVHTIFHIAGKQFTN